MSDNQSVAWLLSVTEVGGLCCKLVQNSLKKAVFYLLFSNLTRCLALSVSWALLLELQDAELYLSEGSL